MELIKQGLAFTKAESLALAEFAGVGHSRDELRFVRFTSTGRTLRASVSDGARALEVTWPIAAAQRLPELEMGVDASFLEKGAKLVTSAEAQRVTVDLGQLLRSVGGLEPAALKIVDTENTKDGVPTVIGHWSERDAVSSQLSIAFGVLRDLLSPPPVSVPVARDVSVQPKFLQALGKVAAASRAASCRMHMPERQGPVLVVFEAAASGATWTVVVAQFVSGAETDGESADTEAACLGGAQTTLDSVRDPVADTGALRMREDESIDHVRVQSEQPRGSRRIRKGKPSTDGKQSTRPTP